jgi:hypothetical protein
MLKVLLPRLADFSFWIQELSDLCSLCRYVCARDLPDPFFRSVEPYRRPTFLLLPSISTLSNRNYIKKIC